MQADNTVRISVDIGGTFTDLHLFEPASRRTLAFKTPSTPTDPSVGLINGLHGITERAGLCLLYTSPSPRDKRQSRMPSSA